MAFSSDLINFDLIETHKENIQSLPGGRSARQLASILSPLSSRGAGAPSFDETKTLNDAIRQEYENELLAINDSDDPLDIYDRYVKWTLNAYPSAQATSQSQLLPLLERATKAFQTSSHYKNDPRYLKLWLHYIRLFSDSPKETFAFLAQHHIGERLGLFYEEYAAWLEGAGRWTQADEVYQTGINKEARPAERLMRKYQQFRQRFEARPQDSQEPSSPALPTVRPALAAKLDPFAAASRADDPQASRTRNGVGGGAPARSGKPKMAIFSDAENAAPVSVPSGTTGWDSIGSIRERKKENTVEARSWAGETLKTSNKVGTASKMEIFKDPSIRETESRHAQSSTRNALVVNPRTGKAERVFVKMEAIYPSESDEFSFEELRAMYRGWSGRDWRPQPAVLQPISGNIDQTTAPKKSMDVVDVENLGIDLQNKLQVQEPELLKEEKRSKSKRTKVREVKQETQTGTRFLPLQVIQLTQPVKTRLESPSSRKVRRKGPSEPTMTFHSKAATNEIYDMFNQPLRSQAKESAQSGDETEDDDDTYSTAGESTGTGRLSAPSSEFGDDTLADIRAGGRVIVDGQTENISPWSDAIDAKHKRDRHSRDRKHRRAISEDLTSSLDCSQDQTQNSGFGAFDTQAIAAIAGQNFEDLNTQAIAMIAGDHDHDNNGKDDEGDVVELKTPIEEHADHIEIAHQPRYVPLPPEDYEPTPVRPLRDASTQNKLPFMTPIVERTESSLAPSTIFQNPDYFQSRTPSRKADMFESPSKLQVDALLLSSPQSGSPQSVKRKLVAAAVSIKDDLSSSPPKKQAISTDPSNTKIEIDLVSNDKPDRVASAKVMPANPRATASELTKKKKGPIIVDAQCNPCDADIRNQILNNIDPSLSSYCGYSDHSSETFNHHSSLKAFADKVSKQKNNKISPRKAQNEKTLTKVAPPVLNLAGTKRVYAVKRELGKGAFAPVYLVDSYDPADLETNDGNATSTQTSLASDSQRHSLEALKTESPPCTLVWEFHILRLLKQRLDPSSRTIESIVRSHECHLYRDEAYLVLSYSPQGTLLDLVNLARSESIRSGKSPEGLDEVLAMYFSLELLRTLEQLHHVGILHGDLKADNCLVRFDTSVDLTSSFDREGSNGWHSKGLCLIDFGRGIDTRCFRPDAKFVADWPASAQDCAEIRECRPWTYQIDYHGAAGVIHSLLFGKYIETVPVSTSSLNTSLPSSSSLSNTTTTPPLPQTENTISLGLSLGLGSLGQTKQYKLTTALKRYWEKDLWTEIFGLLLNPSLAEGGVLPVQKSLKMLIGRIETWLAEESERGGRDLRASLRRMERLVGK